MRCDPFPAFLSCPFADISHYAKCSDVEIRRSAARAMRGLFGTTTDGEKSQLWQALHALLDDEDLRVKYEAVCGLAKLRYQGSGFMVRSLDEPPPLPLPTWETFSKKSQDYVELWKKEVPESKGSAIDN